MTDAWLYYKFTYEAKGELTITGNPLILLHSERPKLQRIFAFLSAIELKGTKADFALTLTVLKESLENMGLCIFTAYPLTFSHFSFSGRYYFKQLT